MKLQLFAWALLCFIWACSSRKYSEIGPWLLPRGKQLHHVEVTRLSSSGKGPSFLSFVAAANLTDHHAQLTALSPLGTTLFAADDERDAKDFALTNVSSTVHSREKELRMLYGRLRPLFWSRIGNVPRDVKIIETNADGSAKKLLWQLGPYKVSIEVQAL